MATTFFSLSPPAPPLILKPKLLCISRVQNPLSFPTILSSVLSSKTNLQFRTKSAPFLAPSQASQKWRIFSNPGNFWLSEANPLQESQEIASTGEDGVSYVVSALLLVAFVGLSILTVGVIYLGVTDFLQKREREKFEKEEDAKTKKKSGKKGKIGARARAGPRGFGQKIEEDDDEL